MEHAVGTASTINFTDAAHGAKVVVRAVGSLLQFRQSVHNVEPKNAITQRLTFTDSVTVQRGPIYRSVKQAIYFADALTDKAIPLTVSQVIGFQHFVHRCHEQSIHQWINFYEGLTGDVAKSLVHSLSFSDVVSYASLRPRINTDTLVFDDGATCYIERKRKLVTAPLTAPVTLTRRSYCEFIYGTRIVQVKNPELDNSEALGYNRINRKSRGGTLILFRDAAWPKVATLNMNFINLTETQRSDLLAFLADTVGLEIEFIDYQGVHYIGIVTTPSDNMQQPHRQCHSFQVQMECSL